MTLFLKTTSHKTSSQYIMLQDFAFKQVLEFALTSFYHELLQIT